jgi:YD repeat-containing protein
MSIQSQQLGIFGWNWYSPAQAKVTTNLNSSVTISNAASLFALMPQQAIGTALTAQSTDLSIQDLIPGQSASEFSFELQADGTYKLKGNGSATLTKVGNQHRLQQKDGTFMMFRPDGQVDYVQDANGYRITANYDSNGLLTGLNTTSGESFAFAYNAQGRVSRTTDQAGQQTNFSYDSTGQLLTNLQDASGSSLTYTYGTAYDPFAITSITDGSGNKVTYDYDEFGRLQQQLFGDEQQQLIYRYDSNGNYTITNGNGAQTKVEYLSGGQVMQVTDPMGRVTQYAYDANGMLDKVTGALGLQLDYNFCGCGELRSIVNALGNTTRFTYATNGNLASVTDARNNAISYGYDAGGNLETITYADGSQQLYDYNDTNGLLTTETNRRGQTATYSYDSNRRLSQERFADNSTVTYGYNTTTGLLNSITDSRGTTTINYNQATNQLAISYSGGRSVK